MEKFCSDNRGFPVVVTMSISWVALLLIFMLFNSCHRKNGLFISLSSSGTNIKFVNKLPVDDRLSILSYIYYYNGAGVAIGDINNDGKQDLYFASNSKGGNKLYLNKGDLKFEDVTDKADVAGTSDWCTGVTMADVNGDGWLDIYVCAVAHTHNLEGHNQLFLNKGDGTFTECAAQYGLDFSGYSTQAAFFDFDHDGDLDCFILNHSEHPNQYITDTSKRRIIDPYTGGRLYRNDRLQGHCHFTDISAQAGIYQSPLGYGLGLAVADLNNDGWDDIYVGNDFHENDYYYINQHNGSFIESGAQHFRHYSRYSMGNDIGDFDNDGQLDIITVDMLPGDEKNLKNYGNGEHLDTYRQKITSNGFQDQYSRNCLQHNNGNGSSFSDVGLIGGISATDWSWSPLFIDMDNDGIKDLFISTGILKRPLDLDFISFYSGIRNPAAFGSPAEFQEALLEKMPEGTSHPFFYKGDGHMKFADISSLSGIEEMKGCYNGAAYGDLNKDGKIDLVINCLNDQPLVLENNAPAQHFISLAFEGTGMNTFGVGVKAYAYSEKGLQYGEMMPVRGFMSSSEPTLHFGLGNVTILDSLVIVWPNQQRQVLAHIKADQFLRIQQKNAQQADGSNHEQVHLEEPLQDITSALNIAWKHHENAYDDFNSQYLIPHMESTRGPGLAIADVDGDGLEDLFVCGASGQPGSLMRQSRDGKLVITSQEAFQKNAACEGVAAVFLDVNKDGAPDLYVASGGNEFADGDSRLADHLYINDGKGHFHESIDQLPPLRTNKSCVAVADVNHDGNPDIFVGGLANAQKYGYSSTSYLLLNNGQGKYTIAGEEVISLKSSGMVTSAAFTDLNKDGWMDLVIAGEWMPVMIFINHGGRFYPSAIQHSSGLWQSLYCADINGDGLPDILAGNWGHNSKLFAGKDGPLRLYVKDFDNNGSPEQIITYTIKGKEYPFLGKDQLEMALPRLKQQHLGYNEVAGKTVQYLFGNTFNGLLEKSAETLSSSCFINDGHGRFERSDLPDALQLSPVFTFSALFQKGAFIAAGNFYGVIPYEGRYDALNPTVFDYDRRSRQFHIRGQMTSGSGEFRNSGMIRIGRENVLVLTRNNDSLVFLR